MFSVCTPFPSSPSPFPFLGLSFILFLFLLFLPLAPISSLNFLKNHKRKYLSCRIVGDVVTLRLVNWIRSLSNTVFDLGECIFGDFLHSQCIRPSSLKRLPCSLISVL